MNKYALGVSLMGQRQFGLVQLLSTNLESEDMGDGNPFQSRLSKNFTFEHHVLQVGNLKIGGHIVVMALCFLVTPAEKS